MELESFAATLAPHVDRLFVAGHGAARPYAAVIREEFGLAGFGVLIDLRALLLAPHGMTFDQAYALERYHDPDEIRANLAQHVEEGY